MFKTTARLAAVTFTAGALALAGAASAGSASAATTSKPDSTGACKTVSLNCQTPVVAVSATSSTDLTPSADFAMRYAGPRPSTGVAYGDVRTDFSNSLQDGTEDWTWVPIATVPLIGRGAFRFTGFDRTNFGGKPVYELRYTPFGQDTNLCLTISSRYRPNGAVLGNCISAAQQAFIVTQTAPGLAALANWGVLGNTSAYQYAFDVSQAASLQHHLALLAPHANINGELIAAGNAVAVARGKASLNMWSTTP
jgi:hypothetical protein